MSRAAAELKGIADGDWVTVTRTIATVPVKLMEGVNADTVWTWNAIGKRASMEPGR